MVIILDSSLLFNEDLLMVNNVAICTDSDYIAEGRKTIPLLVKYRLML